MHRDSGPGLPWAGAGPAIIRGEAAPQRAKGLAPERHAQADRALMLSSLADDSIPACEQAEIFYVLFVVCIYLGEENGGLLTCAIRCHPSLAVHTHASNGRRQ